MDKGIVGSIPSEELDDRFTYHKPSPAQQDYYSDIRVFAHDLADTVNKLVPHCREKSLAMTKIEEAVFWANAGIARHRGSVHGGQDEG